MLTPSEIFLAASTLPDEQRAELAHALLLSLEPDDDDADADEAWAKELERRADEIRQGKGITRDWGEILAEIRESLRSQSAE